MTLSVDVKIIYINKYIIYLYKIYCCGDGVASILLAVIVNFFCGVAVFSLPHVPLLTLYPVFIVVYDKRHVLRHIRH